MRVADSRAWPTPGPATHRGQRPSGTDGANDLSARELERWLCGPAAAAAAAPALGELDCVFGLCLHTRESGPEHTTLRRRLRLALAVLRDLFPADAGVRRWLCAPHEDAGGECPIDLLTSGRGDELAELAVREWNRWCGVLAPTVALLPARADVALTVRESGARGA